MWLSSSGVTTNSEGREIVQAVSRGPLAAKTQLQFQTSPYGICGGQSDWNGFLSKYFGLLLSVSPHQSATFIQLSKTAYQLSK